MIGKLQTALWFAGRPNHWAHAAALTVRKILPDHDGPSAARSAAAWAAERAVPVQNALQAMDLGSGGNVPALSPALVEESRRRAIESKVRMGGPADLDLLYAAVALSGAKRVVETGVAYGWSSLAILAALEGRAGARLVSVDMPYPKMRNEPFVGIVVPDRLRNSWEIIREPDRNGLRKAIARLGGRIDLCHYDSDKSWWGRHYGFGHIWEALEPGGLLIVDDIQDNMAFADFVARHRLAFAVTESAGKFVGVVRKPGGAARAPS